MRGGRSRRATMAGGRSRLPHSLGTAGAGRTSVLRKQACPPVIIEGKNGIGVAPVPLLHAGRSDRHAGNGDPRHGRSLAQQPLDVGGGYMPLHGVSAHAGRVAGRQAIWNTVVLPNEVHMFLGTHVHPQAIVTQVCSPTQTAFARLAPVHNDVGHDLPIPVPDDEDCDRDQRQEQRRPPDQPRDPVGCTAAGPRGSLMRHRTTRAPAPS